MKTDDQKKALEEINTKLMRIQGLMHECIMLAEDNNLCFSLPWGGEGTSERGMGATYVSRNASKQEKDSYLNWYVDEDGYGWQPSGGSC